LVFHVCKGYQNISVVKSSWLKRVVMKRNPKFKFCTCSQFVSKHLHDMVVVVTLALGLRPRQGFARLQAKREAMNHTTYFRECEKVWGNEPSHPKGVPLWELESRGTSEYSEGNCRGQNSMGWRVLYIIGNLLELRYLKWACIAHLNI